ncbi:enoyl-CoA hydratase/isomerase family protein [Streptomyces sp. NPDC002520]
MREFVGLEVEGRVGTIQLRHRPKNILNRQVLEEIRATALEAAARDDVRAVVVHGGRVRYGKERVFSLGADVAELAELSFADMAAIAPSLSAALSAVADIPKPTVAAITGYALGGGLELALCCDHRIAGTGSVLGLPEILLGVIPGAGGTQRLARLVGPAVAKDLVYTGRMLDADEALALGIVGQVTPMEDVYPAAVEWARRFVDGPSTALAAAKAAIDGGLQGDLATGLRMESHLFASLFATADQKAGMRAYLRYGPGKASFTGK